MATTELKLPKNITHKTGTYEYSARTQTMAAKAGEGGGWGGGGRGARRARLVLHPLSLEVCVFVWKKSSS